MRVISHTVKRQGNEYIGESIARFINSFDNLQIIAIVPQILRIYGNGPKQYEVVEVNILVQNT